jgi:hypothetical protein
VRPVPQRFANEARRKGRRSLPARPHARNTDIKGSDQIVSRRRRRIVFGADEDAPGRTALNEGAKEEVGETLYAANPRTEIGNPEMNSELRGRSHASSTA